MNRDTGKLKMAELSQLERQLAELDAKRAELSARKAAIFSELADGESFDLRVMRKPSAPHRAKLPEVSELDRARARSALRAADNRQRVRK